MTICFSLHNIEKHATMMMSTQGPGRGPEGPFLLTNTQSVTSWKSSRIDTVKLQAPWRVQPTCATIPNLFRSTPSLSSPAQEHTTVATTSQRLFNLCLTGQRITHQTADTGTGTAGVWSGNNAVSGSGKTRPERTEDGNWSTFSLNSNSIKVQKSTLPPI